MQVFELRTTVKWFLFNFAAPTVLQLALDALDNYANTATIGTQQANVRTAINDAFLMIAVDLIFLM